MSQEITLSTTLQDYRIRLSHPEDTSSAVIPSAQPSSVNVAAAGLSGRPQFGRLNGHPSEAAQAIGVVDNPVNWEHRAYNRGSFRQVPPYRPIDYSLDQQQRPWGSNGLETAFVYNMFTGVWIVAVSDSTISILALKYFHVNKDI